MSRGQPAPKKNARGIGAGLTTVLAIVVGLILVAFISPLFASRRENVFEPGSCVRVKGTGPVELTSVDCGISGLKYIVAGDNVDDCAGEYAQIDMPGDERLCLVPDLEVDTCYQREIDKPLAASLKESRCFGSTPATIRFKVTQRADAASVPNCTNTDTQSVVSYAKPRPLTYCFERQNGHAT